MTQGQLQDVIVARSNNAVKSEPVDRYLFPIKPPKISHVFSFEPKRIPTAGKTILARTRLKTRTSRVPNLHSNWSEISAQGLTIREFPCAKTYFAITMREDMPRCSSGSDFRRRASRDSRLRKVKNKEMKITVHVDNFIVDIYW